MPDDVGGRFSVLTAVGLLPIAVSGADLDKLMEGAASGRERAMNQPFAENDAMQYAAVRNILLSGGNSSTARAKEKTRRVFSRHLWI